MSNQAILIELGQTKIKNKKIEKSGKMGTV